MYDIQLKEKIIHGTTDQPMNALHFQATEGANGEGLLRVPNHWHNYMEINMIRSGSYELCNNLVAFSLKAGDIFILNSGDLHKLKMLGRDCCHDTILFDPVILNFHYQDQWNKEILEPLRQQALSCVNYLDDQQIGYGAIRNILDELFELIRFKENFWYEKSKLKVLEFILLLQENGYVFSAKELQPKSEAAQIERYKRIVHYIENNYQEELSLEELAALIPCNSQYLCRFFKKIAGVTPIQYLIHYRVEQATLQLTETEKSVSEIALDCGFDNISYFIRKFKELQGMTPGEYRALSDLKSEIS